MSYNTLYLNLTSSDMNLELLQKVAELTKENKSLREEIEYLKSCIVNLSDKVSGEDLKNSAIDLSFLL